jgi:hypothetical protein
MIHTESTIRADARLAKKYHDTIQGILNPPEFEKAAHQLYLVENKATQLLHKQFEIFYEVYGTIWPAVERLPPPWRPIAAQEIGRPLQTELKAVLAIPRKLCQSKLPVAIKVILRFHGGGGVSSLMCCRFLRSQLILLDMWKAALRSMVIQSSYRLRTRKRRHDYTGVFI